MSNQRIYRNSLLHALGLAFYVFLVVSIMQNGENWFGQMNNIWGGFAILMLLVLSAGVCGILVFGKPVMLYLDNFKKEAVKFLLVTLAWIMLLVAITLTILALV